MYDICQFTQSEMCSARDYTAFFNRHCKLFLPKHSSDPVHVVLSNGYCVFRCTYDKAISLGDAASQETLYTATLVASWLGLLQETPVYNTIKNATLYGTDQPAFLNWLVYNVASDCLLVKEDIPSYVCVISTFLYAGNINFKNCEIGRTCYDERYSLVLQSPRKVNAHQLRFLLYTFADTVNCDRPYLIDSNKVTLLGHTTTCLSLQDDAPLVLSLQTASPDATYEISLYDDRLAQRLRTKNIDVIMKAMEHRSEPLRFDDDFDVALFFPSTISWPSSILSSLRPSFSFRQLEGQVQLKLSICENTYERVSDGDVLTEQKRRMSEKYEEHTSYIPKADRLLAVSPDNPVLQFIQNNAIALHAIPQSYIANWLLDENVFTVNAAVLLLLRKIQDREPYTLPGSREIIEVMQSILAYLQGIDDALCSVPKERLLTFLNADSLCSLEKVRLGMLPNRKKEIPALYQCLLGLSDADKVPMVREKLAETYKIVIDDSHNIAFAPQETLYVMVQVMHLLTNIYVGVSGCLYEDAKRYYLDYDIWLEGVLNSPSHLLNAGIFPQFNVQKYLSIDHFIFTWGVPVNLLGVTFDKDNKHDGNNMSSDMLWTHDCYDHPLTANAIIDDEWKLDLIEERLHFTQCVRQMSQCLSNSQQVYHFCGESIEAKDLLLIFKGLIFVLLHETCSGTHTRTRVLPSSFSMPFWYKQLLFFNFNQNITSKHLLLNRLYGDFDQDLKKLLPIGEQSSVPFRLAVMLFDVLVSNMKDRYEKNEDFTVDEVLEAFQEKCLVQEKFICLLAQDKQWMLLVEHAVLPKRYALETSQAERKRLLNLPNVQALLANNTLPWALDEED